MTTKKFWVIKRKDSENYIKKESRVVWKDFYPIDEASRFVSHEEALNFTLNIQDEYNIKTGKVYLWNRFKEKPKPTTIPDGYYLQAGNIQNFTYDEYNIAFDNGEIANRVTDRYEIVEMYEMLLTKAELRKMKIDSID